MYVLFATRKLFAAKLPFFTNIAITTEKNTLKSLLYPTTFEKNVSRKYLVHIKD